MANSRERAGRSAPWRPISARHHNALIDVAEKRRQTEFGEAVTPGNLAQWTDTIRIKNSSGSDLSRGRVLQLGDLLNTDNSARRVHLFDGVDTAPDGSDTIAILLQAIPDEEVGIAQLSGLVFCRLNLQHLQHKWADVDTNDAVLQSHWHGRCEILWTSTVSTGEQDAIVRIGQMHRGPINGVITEVGGISSGGSGEVTVWWGGLESSPASTLTAWLNWMSGGTDGGEGAECQVWWHPDQQKYVIGNLECSG